MSVQLTKVDRYGDSFRVKYENVLLPLGGTTRYYISEYDGEAHVEIIDGMDG